MLTLFGNETRLIVEVDNKNVEKQICNLIKDYLTVNTIFFCLIDNELINPINNILQQTFVKDSFKIIQCAEVLED